jgi:hypothetical protein
MIAAVLKGQYAMPARCDSCPVFKPKMEDLYAASGLPQSAWPMDGALAKRTRNFCTRDGNGPTGAR